MNDYPAWGVEPNIRCSIRQMEPRDLTCCHHIEIKSQEFPFDRFDLSELFNLSSVNGMILLHNYLPAGFAMFSIKNQGQLIDVLRLSVRPEAILDGGLHKMLDSLQVTVGDTSPPTLRLLLPETEIETPFFRQLLEAGFRGVKTLPKRFRQYGDIWDGIILERS